MIIKTNGQRVDLLKIKNLKKNNNKKLQKMNLKFLMKKMLKNLI